LGILGFKKPKTCEVKILDFLGLLLFQVKICKHPKVSTDQK